MTDYTELKRLAEAANAVTGDVSVDIAISGERGPNQSEIDAVTALVGAATPAVVLAMIAEIEQDEMHMRAFSCVAETAIAERDQLKAQVAGLKTGYEAYEQVNAELKAENERLRSGMKGDYDLDAWFDWAREAEALRKDAERYRAIRDEIPHVDLGRAIVSANDAAEYDAAVDAAMGKGEQS